MFETLTGAHDGFYDALAQVFAGDSAAMEALWSDAGDVTNLGPFADRTTGSEAVREQYRAEAARRLGGQVTVSDLHIVETGDMGFSVCNEHGAGHIGSDGEPFELSHRSTKIFRREVGGWRLVHHHTDRAHPRHSPGGPA